MYELLNDFWYNTGWEDAMQDMHPFTEEHFDGFGFYESYWAGYVDAMESSR